MPKYVIERTVPDAGKMSDKEFKETAQVSCDVLREMGPEIQWVHSYVADDKIFCLYISPNEKLITEHAKKGGFPVDKIYEVKKTIDPTTSE